MKIQTYMLSELLDSLEHTTDEVGSHEGLGKLVSVFVGANPKGVLLLDFISDDSVPDLIYFNIIFINIYLQCSTDLSSSLLE